MARAAPLESVPDMRNEPHAVMDAIADTDEFWTLEEVCCFFGGKSKPIDRSTLYKGAGKKYPKPVKVGPQTSRWLKGECVEARRRLIAARGEAFAEASEKMVKARKKGKRKPPLTSWVSASAGPRSGR